MNLIERHASKTLKKFAGEFPAVLITGARQTGKTTILKSYTDEQGIDSLTFDDPQEELSAKTDPKAFIEFHKSPYMFDEIQYVPELFRYIKMSIDMDRHNGMFFLTGSQQVPLAEKASESLAGRVGILQLYPLSQREIRNETFDAPFIPNKEYINYMFQRFKIFEYSVEKTWNAVFRGGYPELVATNIDFNDFFSSYVKTYIQRDINKLTQIENEMQFMQFITVVASRTGQLVNYADMARDVGISEVTAKKWLSLLITSGLVYMLKPYSSNIEKRIVKTPKLYFMDTGLAAYLTRWTNPHILRTGAMAGNFFETFVVSEIVKSFANQGIDPPLYFYRDKDKYEIDMLITIDGTLYPIEIKKTATPGIADAKNFFITQRIKNIKIADPIIICNCSGPVMVGKGVTAIPVDWV